MKRSQILLAVVAALLVVALFYLLLFQPRRDEVAELEAQVLAEEEQQQLIQAEIDRLRLVRDDAPRVEADVVTAEAVVPRDPALPSALRQLQLAAQDAGVTLQSVTTTRPAALEDAEGPPGLSAIGVDLQLVGNYFQVVDFLRRVEDPSITPRGLSWNNATVARDDYPELNVALTGEIYAFLEAPPAPEAATEPVPEGGAADAENTEPGAEGETDVEADVDVEVETQTEDAS